MDAGVKVGRGQGVVQQRGPSYLLVGLTKILSKEPQDEPKDASAQVLDKIRQSLGNQADLGSNPNFTVAGWVTWDISKLF